MPVFSIKSIGTQMCNGWSQPPSQLPTAKFLSLYSTNVEWYDHAFLMRHIGHAGIETLRQGWLGANHDYVVKPLAIHPTEDGQGAVVQYTASGRFAGDMKTLKGEVMMEKSGREFVYRGVVVLKVDGEGKIERVDEYYTKLWDESVDPQEYMVNDPDRSRSRKKNKSSL